MDQYDAAYAGDLVRVKELVTAANVNAVDDGLMAVLLYACEGGHAHVAEWLIEVGADVHCKDERGNTPLHLAAPNASARCVAVLLAAGADPALASGNGSIPLHCAFLSTESAALLISAHPAGVWDVCKRLGNPLHHVAYGGTVDVCRVLLDAGCITDAFDSDRRTPLWWAFFNRKRDNAELLLDHGARLDRVKLDGEYVKAIPEWAVAFAARRDACRVSCWVVLKLARCRSPVIGRNQRDVLGIVARIVWESRRDPSWVHENGPRAK